MKRTLLGLLLLASTAHADMLTGLGAQPGIEVIPHGHVAQGVCFAPVGETLAEKIDAPAPTFRRQHDSAAADWAIDISASLRRVAWRGNAVFTFYDLDDPGSLDADRYTALYQAPLFKSKELFAHAHLSPVGGFRAGHTYRMRVAQIINGQEFVLAESDLRLE